MTLRTSVVVCFLLLFAFAALAADVTGKWVAQIPGRDGQARETTFNLKASGDSLTVTMSGRGGDVNLADGKVSGDAISFTATMERGGNTIKWTFTGKVSGDQIQFKREGGQGQAREFVAKRAN